MEGSRGQGCGCGRFWRVRVWSCGRFWRVKACGYVEVSSEVMREKTGGVGRWRLAALCSGAIQGHSVNRSINGQHRFRAQLPELHGTPGREHLETEPAVCVVTGHPVILTCTTPERASTPAVTRRQTRLLFQPKLSRVLRHLARLSCPCGCSRWDDTSHHSIPGITQSRPMSRAGAQLTESAHVDSFTERPPPPAPQRSHTEQALPQRWRRRSGHRPSRICPTFAATMLRPIPFCFFSVTVIISGSFLRG